MRISGGDARGIRLRVAPGTRPTSEVVRAAVFSSLDAAVVDARVLDLYCGSGAYGLEALSRGARSAVFVDRDRRAIEAARTNARATGAGRRASFRPRDARRYAARDARRDGPFDLVFADPPYDDRAAAAAAVQELAEAVRSGGRLVVEARKDTDAPSPDQAWVLEGDRTYGDTRILVYRRTGEKTPVESSGAGRHP